MTMAIAAGATETTAKETSIIDIGAWTARGEQKKLEEALKRGFDIRARHA